MNNASAVMLGGLIVMLWAAKDVIVLSNLEVITFAVGVLVMLYGIYQWLLATPIE